MGGRTRLFSEELSNRARAMATSCLRGNADRRQGKKVFPMLGVKDWKRLSRAVGHPPSVGVFEPWLGEITLGWVISPALRRQVDEMVS